MKNSYKYSIPCLLKVDMGKGDSGIEVKMELKDFMGDLRYLEKSIKAEAQGALGEIASRAYASGVKKASRMLGSTLKQFLSHFHLEKLNDNTYAITVDGDVEYLEEGYASFNIRDKMLKHAKRSAEGYRYIVVPFDHTPSKMSRSKSKADIVNLINDTSWQKVIMDGNKRLKGGRTVVGMARMDHYQSYELKEDGGDLANLAGMVRSRVKRGRGRGAKTSTEYKTFRTISEKSCSSPNYWWHPGFKGVHALKTVVDYIFKHAEKIAGA